MPTSVADASLDWGETEAIALALELRPDTVLMDERLGRKLATRLGLQVTGLLGLLVLSKQRGLVKEVAPLIRELQDKGNCWFGRDLLIEVCAAVGEAWN